MIKLSARRIKTLKKEIKAVVLRLKKPLGEQWPALEQFCGELVEDFSGAWEASSNPFKPFPSSPSYLSSPQLGTLWG